MSSIRQVLFAVLALSSVSAQSTMNTITGTLTSTATPETTTMSSEAAPTSTSTASALSPACQAQVALNLKISACGPDFTNYILGSGLAANKTLTQASLTTDLGQFCSADCSAALPQLIQDLGSSACASDIQAITTGVSASDSTAIVTFLSTFVCLKDATQYCLVEQFAALDAGFSPTAFTNITTGCTVCAAEQVAALAKAIPTVSSDLQKMLTPFVTGAQEAQKVCAASSNSAAGMGFVGGLLLAAAAMMF